MASAPATLTLNLTSTSPTTSPDQPEKSFRWVEAGSRVRKQRVRKYQGRSSNSPDSHCTDSGSSDDAASPTSEDSFEGAVVPYAYRMKINPALNSVASSQTRKMFSHCMSPSPSTNLVLTWVSF